MHEPAWRPRRFLATGTQSQQRDCLRQVRRSVDLRSYYMPFAHAVRSGSDPSPRECDAPGRTRNDGWRIELIVPIQDYSAGPALLGLVGRSLPEAETILARSRRALAITGIEFHLHARPLIKAPRSPAKPALSDREMTCLRLMALGYAQKHIGTLLKITPEAVNVHLRKAAGKLSADSSTHAVVLALNAGLIQV